ncbi:leucyl/phenylalanyl-tRNA--protein transferase [Litorivivens sp.]|uniref:leucyl/phenylalanyl-tRNA--protein transferase n=1 Tax=Litorivivens sp. TaxID=2020868 RepID=UPI003563CA68
MSSVYWLDPDKPDFPPLSAALQEPNGLLAVGGDLSPERLLAAYQSGIFPWYEDPQPVLWWSPDPRAVLFPNKVHVSRSLRKVLKRGELRVTVDTAFRRIISGCSTLDQSRTGTWITREMLNAYIQMHELGWAHSVEVWRDQTLVGGLYGIGIGRVFFGESMFSRESNASKIALVALCEKLQSLGVELIDCQVGNPHLFSMGAENISRQLFAEHLQRLIGTTPKPQQWGLS